MNNIINHINKIDSLLKNEDDSKSNSKLLVITKEKKELVDKYRNVIEVYKDYYLINNRNLVKINKVTSIERDEYQGTNGDRTRYVDMYESKIYTESDIYILNICFDDLIKIVTN